MTGARRLRAAGAALVLALGLVAAVSARDARAGDPLTFEAGADEGACVKLMTGGPRGCGMVPSGVPPGLPGQVWHVPWQEYGLKGDGTLDLWKINNHGRPVKRPPGAFPITVMDHTILIVYRPDGKTPMLIGEFLPEAEGNWQIHKPGSKKWKEYFKQIRNGTLIPGPTGVTNGKPVGAKYGLFDHCCTNTANAQLDHKVGGPSSRGLNWVGYQSNRCGFTPFVRDNAGRCYDAAASCSLRFGPGINRVGSCAPDAFNNGMMMGEGGFKLGRGFTNLFTDDPLLMDIGGGTGAAWMGTIGVESAVYQQTGQLLLPARFSPSVYTARGLTWCARTGRLVATNPTTAVAAGTVVVVYQANNYRVAVDELTAMDDLSGLTEQDFDEMYNIGSKAFWRSTGAYWGLCDPLPPPKTVIRGRPMKRNPCGGGNVQAPNVDPPYEGDGDAELGGCAAGGRGGAGGAGALVAGALGALGLALRARRRRDAR